MMKIEGRKGGNIDLEEKFLSAITRQPKRRSGIHVTALREECMKMSYLYHVKESPDFKPNKKNLLTFWIGRELHKTPILAQNELILDWKESLDHVMIMKTEFSSTRKHAQVFHHKQRIRMPDK